VFLASSVDVAKSVGELVCSWPAYADEDIEDIHDGGVALGSFPQHRSVLGEVLLDHLDHEFFRELLVLITIFAARADDVAYQDEDCCRVEVDEVFEGFEDVVRGVWVADLGELLQDGLRVLVEDVGGRKVRSWFWFLNAPDAK